MDQGQIERNAKKQNRQPRIEKTMNPRPEVIRKDYKASRKLAGKTALVNTS